ncbi:MULTISPECIES: hypothetical protein [unclassified Paenibacillus]|uniref:hypothetical protein n=1 Tax=unclassified Paenibacillus TaxID=185978 RepID=UPI0036A92D05
MGTNEDLNEGTHQEVFFLKTRETRTPLRIDPAIRWYNEEMEFETTREAYEWVSSDAYNKIGYDYDGYRTTDSKLAYALLFELVRANTAGFGDRKVFADEEYVDNDKIFYLVWVQAAEQT